MYRLYIANKNYSSWSLRPWLLMRARGIPFAEQLVQFIAGSNYERFREFAPNATVPCLHDAGTVVWDSLAIAEYLAERHPGIWPADGDARAWARSATAEMHSSFTALRNTCPMCCGLRVELDEIPPALAKDVARIDELWSEGLQHFGGPHLAGEEFTAVDAFFAPIAFRAQTFGLELGDSARAYRDRLLAHAAMREWYAAALAETWREPAHEAEIAAVGRITADHRAGA